MPGHTALVKDTGSVFPASTQRLCTPAHSRYLPLFLGDVSPMSSPLEAGEKFAISSSSGICKKGRAMVSEMRV